PVAHHAATAVLLDDAERAGCDGDDAVGLVEGERRPPHEALALRHPPAATAEHEGRARGGLTPRRPWRDLARDADDDEHEQQGRATRRQHAAPPAPGA